MNELNGAEGNLDWIEQNGLKVFYEQLDGGDEDRALTPVILHHGMAQSWFDWQDVGWGDAFGQRAAFAIDALGHGRSDRPSTREPYSVENRAETVIKVADACGIDKFVFFGFSMGGRVGFELALSHPERVEKLIVGGMHGLKPSIDRRNLERRIAVLRSSKWRLVERAVGAHRSEQRNNTPEALALSTEAVLDWRGADDRLQDLRQPTLLFCGANDSLLEYAVQTAELIPGCDFVELPGTNHAASFYTSEQAKSAVRQFLPH